jgi:hypothetical protein
MEGQCCQGASNMEFQKIQSLQEQMEKMAAAECGANSAVNHIGPRPGVRAVDQLRQLVQPRWDGHLIDKSMRDQLFKAGLVDRIMGWNFLTSKGVEYCVTLGILST